MGLFNTTEKRVIAELREKSENISNEISSEIDELLEELKSEYDTNRKVVHDFNDFAHQIKTKLSPEEASLLLDFTVKLAQMKRCAKKGVEAMKEIARDQRKATRETIREYEEYLT